MTGSLRWGILGGRSRISSRAVEPAIVASQRGEVVAVASRDASGSDAPYAALLARDDVDIVYIPLPNGLHRQWVLAALDAGKHVLCEKPLGMGVGEATELYDHADAVDRILIEAYMSPFHPRAEAVERELRSGVIGDLRSMRAVFSFGLLTDRPDDHRFDDALGGGASLDVGIYCVAPMLQAAGDEPVTVAATAVWHAPRTDRSLSAFLDFGDGVAGSFDVSFETPLRQRFEVVGTHARLVLDDAFNPGMAPTRIVIEHDDGAADIEEFAPASAYLGMVEHVHAVVLDGATPRYGPAESLAVARTIERCRTAAAR